VKTAVTDILQPRTPIEKQNAGWLTSWIAEHISESNLSVMLSLRLGQEYDEVVFINYVERLSHAFPKFAFVVILDKSGSHVGHISPKVILGSRAYNPQMSLINQLLDSVKESHTDTLFEIYGMRRETVTLANRLAQALRMMKDLRVEELLVVNSLNSPSGVLEQTAVLSELVLELIS
jgi:hypothetical protein